MNQPIFDRDTAIAENISLVEKVARRVAARLPPNVQLDDLKSAGFIGLLDAADKFSDEKGTPFRVYAEIRIRGAMMDELRAQDWVPRSVRDRHHKLTSTLKQLEEELGRKPSEHELAQKLEISVEELKRMRERSEIRSLISFEDMGGRSRPESDRRDPLESLPDPQQSTPELLMLEEADRLMISRALRELPERKRLVLKLYFFDDMKLREIGETLGVTESRVCQIQSEALKQLKLIVKRLQRG